MSGRRRHWTLVLPACGQCWRIMPMDVLPRRTEGVDSDDACCCCCCCCCSGNCDCSGDGDGLLLEKTAKTPVGAGEGPLPDPCCCCCCCCWPESDDAAGLLGLLEKTPNTDVITWRRRMRRVSGSVL